MDLASRLLVHIYIYYLISFFDLFVLYIFNNNGSPAKQSIETRTEELERTRTNSILIC